MSIVAVRDLVKMYAGAPAVDGVSFTIERGEVYLLGENGAGKTTTVEVLEGHRTATSGSVRVLDTDPADADRDFRNRIGIVLQSSAVEPKLSVREVLTLYRRCYRRSRPADLALGIIGYPDLLFLDEPTTGFDPAARRGSWDLIRSLCSGGTTVLLTSHYLEVKQLAGRVGVLPRGRLVAEGTPEELAASTGDTTIRFRLPDGVDRAELSALVDDALPPGETSAADVTITTTTPTTTLPHAHRVVGSAKVIALVALLLMLVLGFIAYDLEFDAAKLPAALVTFVVGIAAFSALGSAVGGLVRNQEAAP